MRIGRIATALMGGIVLSCQGPAAVLAAEGAGAGALEHRTPALAKLDRQLAHLATAERTPAIRARLAEP